MVMLTQQMAGFTETIASTSEKQKEKNTGKKILHIFCQ